MPREWKERALLTRAQNLRSTNATHTGMLSLDNFIDWYWVTCDVWPSIKDSLGDEKKPPANFDLVWEDTILSAKLAFDTFDNGDPPLSASLARPPAVCATVFCARGSCLLRCGDRVMACAPTGDTGLIPPEAMLEVAKVVWESKPSGEAITVGERVKLSEELLHYRQRANNGLMSFQDFTAWHSRISQVPHSASPRDDAATNLWARQQFPRAIVFSGLTRPHCADDNGHTLVEEEAKGCSGGATGHARAGKQHQSRSR